MGEGVLGPLTLSLPMYIYMPFANSGVQGIGPGHCFKFMSSFVWISRFNYFCPEKT
jgi:hypothetical protein